MTSLVVTTSETTSAQAVESSSAGIIAEPEPLPVVSSMVSVPVPGSESAEIEDTSEQIRRALECPICLTLMSVVSCFCPSGHAVCQACMLTLLNTNENDDPTCPLCRTALVESSAMIGKLAEMFPLVKVTCSNWLYGCTELVPVRHVREHESGCRYVPVVCQVAVCQWVGKYKNLYEHVSNVHPGVAVSSATNRLSVTDVRDISSTSRRTYLVRTEYGLIWVLLSRAARSRIQVGLFLQVNSRTQGSDEHTVPPPTEVMYRVKWFDDANHDRSRTRFRTRMMEWSAALKPGCQKVLPNAYSTYRSRANRMEISWFRSAGGSRNSRRSLNRNHQPNTAE